MTADCSSQPQCTGAVPSHHCLLVAAALATSLAGSSLNILQTTSSGREGASEVPSLGIVSYHNAPKKPVKGQTFILELSRRASLPCIADIITFALIGNWGRAEPGMPKPNSHLGITGSDSGLQGGHGSVFR